MAKRKPKTPATTACAPSPEMEKKWRAESDLRTLVEAEAIRKDPARLREAKKIAKTQLDSLKKVTA